MTTSAGQSTGNSEQPILRRKRASFTDIFKILVLGDEKVGKTALIVRFLTRKFIGEYENNLDIKYRHTEFIDNNQVLVEVCDSCKNINGIDDNIKWADGFILMYDTTNYSTFEAVAEIKNKIIEIKKTNQVPVIVVGNKVDMDHRKLVDKLEVEHFISENTFLFAEISVSTSVDQVRDVFRMLCKEINSTKRRSRTFLNRMLGGIGSHKK